MLTTQIGNPSPQIPLAVLHQPADWLRSETEPVEVNTDALGRIPLTFLRRLAADERLRADLVFDPVATLARHGIHVDAEQLPPAVILPCAEALDEAFKVYASDEDESRMRLWYGWIGTLTGDD